MKKILFGEFIMILLLVIGVDHLPLFICWLPLIIYNIIYMKEIVKTIPWNDLH